MVSKDLRNLESHFKFGENWSDFSIVASEKHLIAAEENLKRLLGRERLDGLTFLDIGCGSGIHSVAAARLGASVTGFDLDPKSVETSRSLSAKFGVTSTTRFFVGSVFGLETETHDIVYSWGVLHHTGDMWTAIEAATSHVKPDGGEFVVAIYRRTRLCSVWRRIKRFYSSSPAVIQHIVRIPYTGIADVARLMKGTSPRRYRRTYFDRRGMSLRHDVHDWLGGFPYESASPAEICDFMTSKNFRKEAWFVRHPTKIPWQPLGSGCDEYRFASL